MDPALQELLVSLADDDTLEAIIKLREPESIPEGVTAISRFGDIATCRLSRRQIESVWSDERVLSLKAPKLLSVGDLPSPATEDNEIFAEHDSEDLTRSRESDLRRPDLPYTGRGTVIGVIDFGCDIAHPNLIDDTGNTRLLALWDQRGGQQLTSPQPYGYGRVLTAEAINAALDQGDSEAAYSQLDYHPGEADPLGTGSHGTHVIDIAAGNGRAQGSPVGIAPEAELIFVHLAASRLKGLSDLGDSVRILEAIDFIHQLAGDRPCVINTSLGRHAGIHNGESMVEQGMDALLAANHGRAIVQSCGNYFESKAHASGRLLPGSQRTLSWITDRADITANECEVWYAGKDRFAVSLATPNGEQTFTAEPGNVTSLVVEGVEVGRLYHRAQDPVAGDHHINIFLETNAPAGTWRITLSGEEVVDGRFHAWVERDASCPGCQSRFSDADADPLSTTGTICNGFNTIAVGAYNAHRESWPMVSASSSGPTRDGRSKPDLIAPGGSVLAARSQPARSNGAPRVTRKTGTSMAAPHVAGTVALIFEAAGRPLSIAETRRALIGSLDPIEPVMDSNSYRIGGGFLNIVSAVNQAKAIGSDISSGIGSNTDAITGLSQNIDKEEYTMDIETHERESAGLETESIRSGSPVSDEEVSYFLENLVEWSEADDSPEFFEARDEALGTLTTMADSNHRALTDALAAETALADDFTEEVTEAGGCGCAHARIDTSNEVQPSGPQESNSFLKALASPWEDLSAADPSEYYPITEATCTPVQFPHPSRRALHPTVSKTPGRSVNGTVGRAQELLNRFLAAVRVNGAAAVCRGAPTSAHTFITSGMATLTSKGQNPLGVDCVFGSSTELATKMFQACIRLTRDGIIGKSTWAFLESIDPANRVPFRPRPCCILAPDTTFTPDNILDPATIGTHGTSSAKNGHIYCGKAGFVDLGHLRDMIDLTKHVHDKLTASTPAQVIRTTLGIVSIRRPPVDPIETAASIAFDDAMGHELVSWDFLSPGGRNSSFSPEDLVSNFLGTLVGSRAIRATIAGPNNFQTNATNELNSLLTSLDPQTKTESEAAFALINGRWVDFSSALSLSSNTYLKRRNFTRTPFKAGHSSDATTPAFVTARFSARALADYDYFHMEGGKVLARRSFPIKERQVKREARAAFGANFDKP